MVKVVVTFNLAEGSAAGVFEKEFQRAHLPRAYRLPALRKIELAKAVDHLQGEIAYERIMELYFDTLSDADRALKSKAGRDFTQHLAASTVADLNLTICRVE